VTVMTRVAAGVIERDGTVLIAQRKRGRREELKWEFPGGKLEPGETPEGCLARELREELGVETQVEGYVGASTCAYGWGTVELLAYRVRLIAGNPTALADHEEVRWVSLGELAGYDFADADVPIVHLLAGDGASD
jgi:8-oxo-dGTP diphosphatase